jgi:uncharacterized damage-inducible protein DinB
MSMTADEARLLVEYHYWARDRLLQAVEALTPDQYTRDMGNSFRSVRDTLVHLYSAEWIWLSRWQGESPAMMLQAEAYPDLPSLRQAWDAHRAKLTAFVARLADATLRESIAYRTLDGQPWTQPLWQLLQHVVNHATYHRGQVTTMLRQLGVAPPKSQDLIAFYRASPPA